jgi:hypothetical protein
VKEKQVLITATEGKKLGGNEIIVDVEEEPEVYLTEESAFILCRKKLVVIDFETMKVTTSKFTGRVIGGGKFFISKGTLYSIDTHGPIHQDLPTDFRLSPDL